MALILKALDEGGSPSWGSQLWLFAGSICSCVTAVVEGSESQLREGEVEGGEGKEKGKGKAHNAAMLPSTGSSL